jgi:alkylhydroperoxidase/carboxymuconolactone decarboxylase family protein YurZ
MKPTTYECQTPEDRDYTEILIRSALKEAAAFLKLKQVAQRDDGVIPVKYRELISTAVCPDYPMRVLRGGARKECAEAGATREEITETVFVAAVACGRCDW